MPVALSRLKMCNWRRTIGRLLLLVENSMEPVVQYNANYLLVASIQMKVSVRHVCLSFFTKILIPNICRLGCVNEYSIKNLETFNINIFL